MSSVLTSCPVCGGYGEITQDDGTMLKCDNCNGSGKIYVADETPDDFQCPDVLPTDK